MYNTTNLTNRVTLAILDEKIFLCDGLNLGSHLPEFGIGIGQTQAVR